MTRPLTLTPEQRRERRRVIRRRYDNSPIAKLRRKYRRSGFTGFALQQAMRNAQANLWRGYQPGVTMALHEQCVGTTDEWYTPPHVFRALGCEFDLDVSSPGADVTPWIAARRFITAGSLQEDWSGFVWMNPPFGGRNGLVPQLAKFFEHGNGIALVPDQDIGAVVAAVRAPGRPRVVHCAEVEVHRC